VRDAEAITTAEQNVVDTRPLVGNEVPIS